MVIAAAVAGAGCRTSKRPTKPMVVATTTIVADLVRALAGDHVAIDCLMGAGVDPHSYRATPSDAQRLAGADLVVASGLHLEGKLAQMLEKLGGKQRVVFAAEAIPAERLITAAEQVVDPHVWFDPMLWRETIRPVGEALAAIDPAHATEYASRAAEYAERLESLDRRLRERLGRLAPDRRVLITAHDAFGYFGRAYGVEVVGVQGVSTESEAGLADINRLVSLIVDRGIPSIFVETSTSDRNVEAICEGVRAKGAAVRVGGRLYSDALGAEGSGADTLVGMLERNVDTILEGLAVP